MPDSYWWDKIGDVIVALIGAVIVAGWSVGKNQVVGIASRRSNKHRALGFSEGVAAERSAHEQFVIAARQRETSLQRDIDRHQRRIERLEAEIVGLRSQVDYRHRNIRQIYESEDNLLAHMLEKLRPSASPAGDSINSGSDMRIDRDHYLIWVIERRREEIRSELQPAPQRFTSDRFAQRRVIPREVPEEFPDDVPTSAPRSATDELATFGAGDLSDRLDHLSLEDWSDEPDVTYFSRRLILEAQQHTRNAEHDSAEYSYWDLLRILVVTVLLSLPGWAPWNVRSASGRLAWGVITFALLIWVQWAF